MKGRECFLLVCYEDLEGRDEVSQRNGLVRLPLLVRLNVVDEHEEVVLLALVVDLGLGSLASSHIGLGGFVIS